MNTFGGTRLSLRRLSTALPRIVEPHHHYVATNEPFHEPLKRVGVPEYTPENFNEDAAGLKITKAVHMECGPADALAEAQWVESVIANRRTPVTHLVAACNLAAHDSHAQLAKLTERCPHIVGIRYCVDYAGPFGEAPATHAFVSRHGNGADPPWLGSGKGCDFLRDPAYAPQFEAGYAALADHGLTFDLQCAPEQLPAAAALIGRHPRVPVVLDHLGKPRLTGDAPSDAAELETWRSGMRGIAKLPNVFVKLSMLGYAIPGWAADVAKEESLATLVREVIDLFGAERCMFSTNWWANGAMANSDGRDDVPIEMADMWARYARWVDGHCSDSEVRSLFAESAERFYGI